jgi:hypothetical protein
MLELEEKPEEESLGKPSNPLRVFSRLLREAKSLQGIGEL